MGAPVEEQAVQVGAEHAHQGRQRDLGLLRDERHEAPAEHASHKNALEREDRASWGCGGADREPEREVLRLMHDGTSVLPCSAVVKRPTDERSLTSNLLDSSRS